MFFRQVYEKGLAQASYMVGCQKSGTVMVIDPKRDIDTYLAIAEQEKLKITDIVESHIHADFLSGARELKYATGATIHTSLEGAPGGRYRYERENLRDGDILKIGNIAVQAVHTPGHTPEHMSYLVTDTPATDRPIMMFTGDFVFVGDVGRPDLLEKVAGSTSAEEQARMMFASLQRFKALPDYIQVHPAHGAGSACGKALGAIPSSTVGYEKMVNWALRHTDENAFIAALVEGQPEPPHYFATMARLNMSERPVLGAIPAPPRLSVAEFDRKRAEGLLVVDTRGKLAFAGGHIPGSLNIQDNNAMSTWAGWMIEHGRPVVLVTPEERLDEVVRKLIRVGVDNIVGYLPDIEEWQAAGHDTEVMPQMSLDELRYKVENNEVHVLDVRADAEYADGHIHGAQHIHAGYLANRLAEIPSDKPVVVHCAGGDRSSIAVSLMMQKGMRNLYNMPGGFNAWRDAGLPVVRA